MTQENQSNSNALTGLILGILSIVGLGVGLILGIIGLIISNKAINEIKQFGGNNLSQAKVGRTCSIIGIVLHLFFVVIAIVSLMLFTKMTA